MSQHIFSTFHTQTQCRVRIQIGWDRPMKGFYMVVLKADTEKLADDDEGVVYSNLYDVGHPKELSYFRRVAEKLEIQIPEVIWRNAYADGERNVVNHTAFYDAAGNVLTGEQ
ncbi:hypothetical protein [Pseudomonas sp. NPDC089569]|uniref:hypothetical protein n=1 Tax=Pseudomonas sp. NPDC089569 TaxID=3390722 RepID=UPI003D03F0C8